MAAFRREYGTHLRRLGPVGVGSCRNYLLACPMASIGPGFSEMGKQHASGEINPFIAAKLDSTGMSISLSTKQMEWNPYR